MMMMIREIEDGVKERDDFLKTEVSTKVCRTKCVYINSKIHIGAQTKMYLLDLTDTFGVIFCHIQSFVFKQIASPSF